MSLEIIKAIDLEKKINSKGTTLINIFGTWCGPCKMFNPILEEISSEEIQVLKIDVDQNPDYAAKMQIQGVPTTLFFKDGEFKNSTTGFIPKEVLLKKIEEL